MLYRLYEGRASLFWCVHFSRYIQTFMTFKLIAKDFPVEAGKHDRERICHICLAH